MNLKEIKNFDLVT